MRARLISTVIVLLVGCSSDRPAKKKDKVDGPAPAPASVSPLTEAMTEHWAVTMWLRDAVIIGDLERVRRGALQLADQPSPAVPDWTPFVDQMRDHARAASEAQTIEAASTAVAEIGATCGACHVETGASVPRRTEPVLARGGDVEEHMVRHEQAVDLMWSGLVLPSDEDWAAGTQLLRERPLHEYGFFDEWKVTDEVAALGNQVHDVGISAAVPAAERAPVFAKLISTCGDCHNALAPR